MFKNREIICISTIDWDFLWQRHQIFMQLFAREGNRVIYLENLNPSPALDFSIFPKIIKRIVRIFWKVKKSNKKTISNLTIITPIIIPFKNTIAEFINKGIITKFLSLYIKSMGIRNPIIWTYLATSSTLRLINNLKPKFLIYDCVFDASLHPGSPKDIVNSEKKIIESADLIFTDNHYLFKKCKDINPHTYIISPGVDFESFSTPVSEDSTLISDTKRPRICFFGGIDEIRLDLELIEYIAKKRPDWSIVLFGPVIKTDIGRLRLLPNIFLKGTLQHQRLPAALKETDVLILPYKIIPFSKSIIPAKIFECLATGKPIVSTPLEEFNFFENGLIKIAKTKDEFLKAIEDSINYDNEEARRKRLKFAQENSWSERFREINEITEEVLDKKVGYGV